MAMIFLSDEDRAERRSVKVFNTIQGARTGRWCQAEAGAYPDRCDCILEDLSNGVATHFTIQYGTVNGRRSHTGTVIARNAPPSTPTGANSIEFPHGEGPKCSGVAGVFFTLRLLECVTAPATSRSRTAMPRRNEQPTLFELTACDEPEAPRGLPLSPVAKCDP